MARNPSSGGRGTTAMTWSPLHECERQPCRAEQEHGCNCEQTEIAPRRITHEDTPRDQRSEYHGCC